MRLLLRIKIIIVTYNSDQDIDQCILSLSEHCNFLKDGNGEVLVVDNGSTDTTRVKLDTLRQRFKWLQVKYLDTNIGFGPANNLGLAESISDYYVFINADTYLLSDAIGPACNILRSRPNVGVAGLPLVYPNGRPQSFSFMPSSWHRWLMHLLGFQYFSPIMKSHPRVRSVLELSPFLKNYIQNNFRDHIDINNPEQLQERQTLDIKPAKWVAGAAMILTRKALSQDVKFDEDIFLYGEDEDICISAEKNGLEVVTIETTPIVHKLGWQGTSKFNPIVSLLKYKSLKYFIRKHYYGTSNGYIMLALLPFYVYRRNILFHWWNVRK